MTDSVTSEELLTEKDTGVREGKCSKKKKKKKKKTQARAAEEAGSNISTDSTKEGRGSAGSVKEISATGEIPNSTAECMMKPGIKETAGLSNKTGQIEAGEVEQQPAFGFVSQPLHCVDSSAAEVCSEDSSGNIRARPKLTGEEAVDGKEVLERRNGKKRRKKKKKSPVDQVPATVGREADSAENFITATTITQPSSTEPEVAEPERDELPVKSNEKCSSVANSPAANRRKKKKKKKKSAKKFGVLVSELTGNNGSSTPERAVSDEASAIEEVPEAVGVVASEGKAVEAIAIDQDHESKSATERNPADDLEKFTSETTLLDPDKEENNILRVFKLMYGVGLTTLRKVFMDIHPTWSNQPGDAATLERGAMKLKSHEAASFNAGDIQKWDFSLITTVLLFSKKCFQEIAKKPGFEPALRELKDCKNKLLSHPSDDKMSDADFNVFWTNASKHLKTVGANLDVIVEILKDDIKETGKYYRDQYLEEIATTSRVLDELRYIRSTVDAMAAKTNADAAPAPSLSPRDLSGPNWDEWMKFCDSVGNFDHHENQYILVTDAMPAEDLEHFSSLRSVSWKMVLDFDPFSEEKGMYQDYVSRKGRNNLISMVTPAEIRRLLIANLAKHIDPNKTQWLFVNGRHNDIATNGGPQNLADWEAFSVKQISRFFCCYSDADKFDKYKPVICFVLPFRNETIPYLEVTLNKLTENFDEFNLTFVTTKHELCDYLPRRISFGLFDLSPGLLDLGMRDLFPVFSNQEYRMPTSQAKLTAKLTQNDFLYLKEYLDILYDGCEELPEKTSDAEDERKLEEMLSRHRESFMSGNWISLVGLFDNHDAKREIGNDVRTHIQRLLDQGLTHSTIVEIRHSPGTGGTTIARRVLWDLHKSYPCAFARLEDHSYDYDDDLHFIDALVDRISALQEICHTTPVVLLDGKHMRIEVLSNRLVRTLNDKGQRALLLRCQHGSKVRTTDTTSDCFYVHERFSVNVKLEESRADLNEFQAKYKDYIEGSLKDGCRPCRVFHFPLMAMLEAFRSKLQQIVYQTFDEMSALEKEIAVVVAFLQKYAVQPTPASLLYEAFKDSVRPSSINKGVTYKDINQLFTEHLLNLMVAANPARLNYQRSRYGHQRVDAIPESYTLQHPIVADLVLKKVFIDQKRDLFAITSQFLRFPIFDDERFYSLMSDLFVRNKCGLRKLKFAVLFEDLKSTSPERAAEVFCEAAEKTRDAVVFANAARFHAKKKPASFSKAKEIIMRAIDARNAKQKTRTIYDTKGVILYIELTYLTRARKMKSLDQLETIADEALKAFKNARNFPPTFPNPLIGEVKVWLACIEWIMANRCQGDSDKTLKFISSLAPPFFRTCVSDSFYLLDIVDGIVHSVTSLQDPEETQRQANSARLSLMKTFNKGRRLPGGQRDTEDVIRACKALCSSDNFPKSSQCELKRLQAQYLLSCTDQIETIKKEHLDYLLKLLQELVLVEEQNRMAYHLMKICVLVTGPNHYTLEQGLSITEKWLKESHYDPLPYFYQMAIYFLQILDGNSLQYTARYHKAVKMCHEKSQNHCKSTMPTHVVSKGGQGMSRLMTWSSFFRGENDYHKNSSEKVKFWMVDSRKKLLECSGRIRMRSTSSRRRAQPYIELVQGNVELYVGKNADIGQVERDFTPGSMVYFVVSFNLRGPLANGITFKPVSQQ